MLASNVYFRTPKPAPLVRYSRFNRVLLPTVTSDGGSGFGQSTGTVEGGLRIMTVPLPPEVNQPRELDQKVEAVPSR